MILPYGARARSIAARIIRVGGIIAFRTDTFYGLGVDPTNHAAVGALSDLKGREAGKPILVLVADDEVVDRFVMRRSALFDQIAGSYWPGPLTLVALARPELSDQLTAGTGTIGVRLPDDATVRALLTACDGALTGTSANLAGHPPAKSADDVAAQFPTGIDLIIDSGQAEVIEPSTVLDVSGEVPRLIREGTVTRDALRQFQVD